MIGCYYDARILEESLSFILVSCQLSSFFGETMQPLHDPEDLDMKSFRFVQSLPKKEEKDRNVNDKCGYTIGI